MTPCERLGYKVGDEFKVVCSSHHGFFLGEIVTLTTDDGTTAPWFECGNRHHCALIDHVRPISKARYGDDPITLQPGDYVSTEGMTEEQYHAVARAFESAGCPRFDPEAGRGTGRYLEWWDDELVSTSSLGDGGRHLTIDQVLNATNATARPKETTMTTDPITSLKQARATRDEAEQEYQQALAEAREYLGEGFMLTEVGNDAPLVDGENMDDPANWREGDVLTCIDNGGHAWYTEGKQYTIVRIDADGWPVMRDDDGDQSALAPSRMKFHHRPN